MLTQAQINENIENFFIVNSAVNEYKQTKAAITDAIKPQKKEFTAAWKNSLRNAISSARLNTEIIS